MRKQIGVTVLAMAMACSMMAGCTMEGGSSSKAPSEAAKEETKAEAKEESKAEATEAAKEEGSEAAAEGGSGKKYVIGLAMNTQTNPFFVDVKDGVQKAADEHGIEL